jgi:hypothetical protein
MGGNKSVPPEKANRAEPSPGDAGDDDSPHQPIEQEGAAMTTRRLWVPVLAALLVATLVGPAGGAVTAAEPRATVGTITIPAGAFIPTRDDWDFSNAGDALWLDSGTTAAFTAPLFFPVPEVTIRKITLYAYDNGGGDICVGIYRTTPATGGEQAMSTACSVGASDSVRAFTATTFAHRRITGAYGPYLYLPLTPAYAQYRVYGVKITYTY